MNFLHTKWMLYYCRYLFFGLMLHASCDWWAMAPNMPHRHLSGCHFVHILWNHAHHIPTMQCLKSQLSSPGDNECFRSLYNTQRGSFSFSSISNETLKMANSFALWQASLTLGWSCHDTSKEKYSSCLSSYHLSVLHM